MVVFGVWTTLVGFLFLRLMTKGIRLAFWIMLMTFSVGMLHGQTFRPTELTAGLRQVEDLSGYWYTEDKEDLYQVPFTEDKHRLNLVKPLQTRPGSNLADTLFLYFEGLAWRAEVYLNGRLLAITRDPFQEYLFPVPSRLLEDGENLLTVRCSQEGPDIDLYPGKFVGIYRQCFLLTESPQRVTIAHQKRVERAEKVLIYAPWNEESGFQEDTVAFSKLTDQVVEAGGLPLYYAFEAPGSYHAIAQRKGLSRVMNLNGCDSVAFLNAYPLLTAPRNLHPWFWLDEAGNTTSHYASFQSLKKAKQGLSNPPDRVFLLIFLLLPLLGLVLLKFVGPKTWSFLLDYLIKVKFFLDLIRNGKFLKSLSSILINTYGVILMAVCLSVFLYFLQAAGRIDALNILSAESLLYRLMLFGEFSLPEIFGAALVFLLLLASLKVFISYLLSLLYGINSLTPVLQNLEIISTFPLNILLLIPTGALFFIQPEFAWATAIAWQIIFLIIHIRKIITQYAGLSYIFQFSVSLKILYICGLEIMPWVLLV